MDENLLNYKKLGILVNQRMEISTLLKARTPELTHFHAFWRVGVEIALVLAEMGQAKLARASMLLIFKSWCEWGHGDFYLSNTRESLRALLPDLLKELEKLQFMRLSSDERLDLFYMMSPYDWALLKIS